MSTKDRRALAPKDEVYPSSRGQKTPDELIQTLFEDGAVNFKAIANAIPPKMDPQSLDRVRGGAVNKILEIFQSGHFGDLRGARELMDRLDITQLTFSDEFLQEIDELLPRLTETTLGALGRSQPATVGEYNLEGARRLLQPKFPEKELSDEEVKEILDYRHVLLALKEREIDSVRQLHELSGLESSTQKTLPPLHEIKRLGPPK